MNLHLIDLDDLLAAVEDSMFGLGTAGFCTESRAGFSPRWSRYQAVVAFTSVANKCTWPNR